jgi:translation initiation factor 2B subunit (eIF-2B alpha/beta/delta family)
VDIINFAFDQVPGKLLTGIITEFGIIKPSKVRVTVKKEYPWMK